MNGRKKAEKDNRKFMLETPIPKLLTKMSVPMMIAMTVNGLYYLADAAFVGNTVGVNGVAALAVGFPVDMFILSVALMCALGTASMLSLELGKGRYHEASNVLKNAILFTAGLSVLLSIAIFIFKHRLLLFLGADGDIYPHADHYYSVIVPGFILVLLSFLLTNSIRAEGKAKLAAIVNISIKYHGAPLDLSVFGIINRVLVFITMPVNGIGQGVQAIVGYNYGAGSINRVKKALRFGYLYSLIFGGLLFFLLFGFPEKVISLFTNDGSLMLAGTGPLRISTFLVPLIGIQVVTYFYYIAVQDVFKCLVTSVCRHIFFLIPLVLILPYFCGVSGIWQAFPVADLIAAGFCIMLIRSNFNGSHQMEILTLNDDDA
ncbi:MAG: hypothetical protein JW932_18495 [Deltaproteobacteria bacterium]|nr:hypothetical protein [Deltaproteobacteria bacterium]